MFHYSWEKYQKKVMTQVLGLLMNLKAEAIIRVGFYKVWLTRAKRQSSRLKWKKSYFGESSIDKKSKTANMRLWKRIFVE
ncbi:MAG: hypothetical protein B6D40_02320 [Anaerolineae bacterium UTCFX3]|nr:MAG: hypothetical protein B6D40_02320 [Anaerolineae bacterium UTCFX3]